MSYLRRVAMQRPVNQVIEERRKREEEKHIAKLKRGRARFNPKPVLLTHFIPEYMKYETGHLSKLPPEVRAEKRSWKQRIKGFFQKITEIKFK